MNLSGQFAKTGEVPMFATAKEIIDGTLLGDGMRMDQETGHDYTPDKQPFKGAIMDQKLYESGEEATHSPTKGLTGSINKHGYDWKKPVKVSLDHNHPLGAQILLLDGHHRLAVMAKHFPEHQVPIHVVNP